MQVAGRAGGWGGGQLNSKARLVMRLVSLLKMFTLNICSRYCSSNNLGKKGIAAECKQTDVFRYSDTYINALLESVKLPQQECHQILIFFFFFLFF